MKTLKQIGLAILFALSVNGFTGCGLTFPLTNNYSDPGWAPPHYNGARYFYIPDIEVYYDLSDHNFAYLNNGLWIFTPQFPSIYAGFDLYNAFIITLDVTVYQPWRYHQYYVSHYPRYYYHNTYRDRDFDNIRGFNENNKNPVYWQPGERDRINDKRKNDKPFTQMEPQRPPQKTNYSGKPVGDPVRVKPEMKPPKQEQPKQERQPRKKKKVGD
jgi:hypothetical protein